MGYSIPSGATETAVAAVEAGMPRLVRPDSPARVSRPGLLGAGDERADVAPRQNFAVHDEHSLVGVFEQPEPSRGPERRFFVHVVDRDPEAGAVTEVVADRLRAVVRRHRHMADA